MVSLAAHAVLHISVLLWLVNPSISEKCEGYRGYPGVPGIPGAHGANGKDGTNGQKGDPGENTQPVKGQKGEQGVTGPPGRPGLRGSEGMPGPPGPEGPKGQKGAVAEISSDKRSFFSCKKNSAKTSYASQHTIDFDGVISPEMNGDLLSQGVFRAKLKGVYYFVYYVSANRVACLYIKKNRDVMVSLCDQSPGVLVSSGSVVLSLEKDDTVSLHSSLKTSYLISRDADSTFTGFLLFPV